MFLLHLDETKGRAVVKDFADRVYRQCLPWELAASEASGQDWLALHEDQRRWAADFVKRADQDFRPKND